MLILLDLMGINGRQLLEIETGIGDLYKGNAFEKPLFGIRVTAAACREQTEIIWFFDF